MSVACSYSAPFIKVMMGWFNISGPSPSSSTFSSSIRFTKSFTLNSSEEMLISIRSVFSLTLFFFQAYTLPSILMLMLISGWKEEA